MVAAIQKIKTFKYFHILKFVIYFQRRFSFLGQES